MNARTATQDAAQTATQDAAQTATQTSATAPAPSDAPCCGESSTAQSQLPPEPRLNLPAPQVGDAVAAAALLADRTRASI
ncbi:MAG TPA: hypothetical protein VF371_05775, partial [Candidatus Limnocylindrales bacterium]